MRKPGHAQERCAVQAFAAAGREVLREHSAALQAVAVSVHARRLQEQQQRQQHGRAHGSNCIGASDSGSNELTALEVCMHTQALQVSCSFLAGVHIQVCGAGASEQHGASAGAGQGAGHAVRRGCQQ